MNTSILGTGKWSAARGLIAVRVAIWKNEFDGATGILAGAAVGYSFA